MQYTSGAWVGRGRCVGSGRLAEVRRDPDEESVMDKSDDAGELGDGKQGKRACCGGRVSRRYSGRQNCTVRLESKSMSWMKDFVTKFSKGRQLVVDPCTGTFLVTKTCVMLPKHRHFNGCQNDAGCFSATLLSVVEAFVRQELNRDS